MADEKDILFTSGSTVPKSTIKKVRTYGSTSKSASTTSQKTRLHKVRASDTLVSLAIKYETTVEELKRLNGLWSNDGLQLKASIQVPESSAPSASGSRSGSASVTSSRNPTPPSTIVSLEQFVTEDNDSPVQLAATGSNSSAKPVSGATAAAAASSGSSISRSKTFASERDFSEMDTGEFLRKFDLQFMQLKTNVEKLENESSLSEEDTQAANSCMPARRTARYMHSQQARRHHQVAGASGIAAVVDPGFIECSPADPLANPELVVRSQQLASATDVEETFFKL